MGHLFLLLLIGRIINSKQITAPISPPIILLIQFIEIGKVSGKFSSHHIKTSDPAQTLANKTNTSQMVDHAVKMIDQIFFIPFSFFSLVAKEDDL